MKTKNRSPKPETEKPRETFVVGETPIAQNPAPVEQGNGYKAGSKLQISLNEDGSIDWESMRDSTKEKVRAAIRSSNIGTAATPEVLMFNPAMVSGMYDMLGAIEATVAQRFGKIPAHVAKACFTYTPAEKQALEGPTVRVLNKYIPDWMIKYQDEIALASTLIALTTAKVNAAITLSKMSQVQTVEPPPNKPDDPTPPPTVQ